MARHRKSGWLPHPQTRPHPKWTMHVPETLPVLSVRISPRLPPDYSFLSPPHRLGHIPPCAVCHTLSFSLCQTDKPHHDRTVLSQLIDSKPPPFPDTDLRCLFDTTSLRQPVIHALPEYGFHKNCSFTNETSSSFWNMQSMTAFPSPR